MARVFKPVFPRWPASGSPATTPTAEFTPPKVRLQRFSPRERCWDSLCRGLSPAHTTLLPWLIRRNRPARRTADARRRLSDPFVGAAEPHPEAHASRSRPIRSTIAANSRTGHRYLRQLEHDVLGVRHHLGPDLDQLLPQRRQRPAPDRLRQHQLPKEVGQVVGQGEQLQPRRVVLETPARQLRPLHRILALLYPLLRRTPPVVKAHHLLGNATSGW